MEHAEHRRTSRLGSVWRYALAGLISVIAWGFVAVTYAEANAPFDERVTWFFLGDTALGVTSFALMHLRHRRPGLVAWLTTLFSFVSMTSAGPASWMVGSLASHHRWRLLTAIAPLSVVAGLVQERFYSIPDPLPLWAGIIFGLLIIGIIGAIGYAMGSQRDLLDSLRERALTAEREQQARVAQAQSGERTRIAREMHDVLAHRISLVAMHAGALSYRTDLTAEEQATAARTIEDNAHRALRDLREVLGVLRDPTQPLDSAPERPQPRIDDLPHLIEEERASGVRVTLDQSIEGDVPDVVARTAYRVVQEALTNARKHASGTAVTVALSGNARDGLTVTIHNAAPVGRNQTALPESGLGLVGLGERVALTGGRLRHGRTDSGGFMVEAWIPWQA